MTREWIIANKRKINMRVSKIKAWCTTHLFTNWDGSTSDVAAGKEPEHILGAELIGLESIGKHVLVTFRKGHHTTVLHCCRGRGGGAKNGALMSLGFEKFEKGQWKSSAQTLSFYIPHNRRMYPGFLSSSVKIVTQEEADDLRRRLYPLDISGDHFNPDAVMAALSSCDQSQTISVALLNQNIFCGLGNVIRVECLHAHKLQ